MEVPLGILGRSVPPGSPNSDPISDQKMSLFTPVFRPEMINTFINSCSSVKNQTRLQTKIGKVYTRFHTKPPQEPHYLGRYIPYIAYLREYPTPRLRVPCPRKRVNTGKERTRRKMQTNWGIEDETGRLPLRPLHNPSPLALSPYPPQHGAWSQAKHKRHNIDAFRAQQ